MGRRAADQAPDPSKLRQLLVDQFNEGELRDFCFDLHVDYKSLESEGKAGRARELIAYLDRRHRIHELIEIGERLCPDIPWDDATS